MAWYFAILIVFSAFLFMEFWAWFSHKYIMHGFLWVLHKDHHIRDGRKWEYNDLFAFMFAIPSIVLTILGASNGFDYRFYMGIGIALYGLAYFIFHDILVHQRIRILSNLRNTYLRATINAHLDHHKPHQFRNYGFLVAPWKYYKEEFGKQK